MEESEKWSLKSERFRSKGLKEVERVGEVQRDRETE
jgi:hypothetical protein